MDSEELGAYITRMLQILSIPGYNNAAIAGQHIMELVSEHHISLPEIDRILKLLGSGVCIVGLPLTVFPNHENLSIFMPGSDKKFNYAIWIELNGPIALEKVIDRAKLGVDRTLKETGFLCLREQDKCAP